MGRPAGFRCSEETRARMSLASRGRGQSAETIAKRMSTRTASMLQSGRWTIAGIEAKKRARALRSSPDWVDGRKLGVTSGRTFAPRSSEWKRKISESLKARNAKMWIEGKEKREAAEAKKKEEKRLRRQSFIESKRGPNSNLWKGGITPLTRLIRESAKYKAWRKAVFERDDYTCQKCEQRGFELNADNFPKRFSEIFYDNKISSVEMAEACTEFWDISNGRTLCVGCHRKTPTWGRRLSNAT